MENKQINQIINLKINVTRIQSSLLKSNKNLLRVKKDRIKLQTTEQQRKKISTKESSVESASSFRKSVSNIGRKLISGPLSLIDKFKEFFGLILLGIVVNNLPQIIGKFQEVLGNIQLFLGQNPWIIDTVKWFGSIFAQSIMGLAKVIKIVRPYIGGSFKFALDTLKSTKNQIGTLITTFDELDLSFGGLIKDLNVDKIPDVNKDPARYSEFVAGGGKKSLEQKGQTVDEVIAQGQKNIQRYSPTSKQPEQPQPQIQLMAPGSMYPAPQKFARGGTVGNIPSSEGTGRGGPSDVARIAPHLLRSDSKYASPFASPGGSGKLRRARNSLNSFKVFQKNIEDQKYDQKTQIENQGMFSEMLKKFKELSKLRAKEKPEGQGSPNAPGGTPPAEIPIIGGPGIGGLAEFIRSAETGGRYDAYAGDNGKGDPEILTMTLQQLADKYGSGWDGPALGAYQFKVGTLLGLSRGLGGVDPKTQKFDQAFQDRLSQYDINRLGYADFINGTLSQKDFGRRLAIQYRALPDPYTGFTYDDQYKSRNRATRTLDEFNTALQNAKKQKNISLRTAPGADPNLSSQFISVSGTSGSVKINGKENEPINLPYSPFKNREGNPRVSSGYGTRSGKPHRGIDVEANEGTKLYAYLPGKVTKSGDYGDNYGFSFEWVDANGAKHFFGHLQKKPFLNVGDEVKQGQNVGFVGSTGRSTGPHLHWEIRRTSGGQSLTNPETWIKAYALPKPGSNATATPTTQNFITSIKSLMNTLNETTIENLALSASSQYKGKYKIEIVNGQLKIYEKGTALFGLDTEIDPQQKGSLLKEIENELKVKVNKGNQAFASPTSLSRDPNSFVAKAAQLADSENQTNTVVLYQREYVVS